MVCFVLQTAFCYTELVMSKHPQHKSDRNIFLRIGVDILGVLLIIASILFGWLPGVGGIPLFFAGLGLLATNHEWARRLLHRIKDEGNKFIKIIFRDHPVLVIVYDVLSIALLITAAVVFGMADGNLGRSFAAVITFFGFGLMIGNRNRIEYINRFVTKVTKTLKPTKKP